MRLGVSEVGRQVSEKWLLCGKAGLGLELSFRLQTGFVCSAKKMEIAQQKPCCEMRDTGVLGIPLFENRKDCRIYRIFIPCF